MGIFKDTLYPYVNDQFYIRQSMIAHGVSQYGTGPVSRGMGNMVGESRGFRGAGFDGIAVGTNMEGIGSYSQYARSFHTVIKNGKKKRELINPDAGIFPVYAMSEEEIAERNKKRGYFIKSEYWHSWMTQRYCGLRMASMVDLTEETILDLDYEFNGVVLEKELLGYGLARNYMLEGGTLLNPEGFNEPKMRSGFPQAGKLLGTAYGDPLSRSDSRIDEYGESYGIVPMAGITNVSVRTKSAYGSLREAKIDFVCHNLRQLSVMELLYMRPGYPVLLEWGWTPYVGNDLELENGFTYISDSDRFWGRKGTGNQTLLQYEIADMLVSKRRANSGNYDGVLGLCKNFSYTARDDGGFNCSTELMAMGDVLSSLKPKNITIIGNINIDKVKKATDGAIYLENLDSSGANIMKMPTLMDFLLATFDYKYGVLEDAGSADHIAGGYKDFQERHYAGKDEVYGTGDDTYKKGLYYNRSPRNQTAPIVRKGLFYIDRRVTFNIDRDMVEKTYENEFFDNGSGNIPPIYKPLYLMHFAKGRDGWATFWKGAEALAGYYADRGSWLAWGLELAIDFFTDDKRVLSECYIRLDALLYIINSRCMTEIPKKPDQKITCYQTLQHFPNKPSGEKYRMHEMNSYQLKSQQLFKSLWWEDRPTGAGFTDRSAVQSMMDGSVDPYTCLMPWQFPDQFGIKLVNNVYELEGQYNKEFIQPCRNFVGFPDEDFETGAEFDKSFPGKTKAEKQTSMQSIGHIMLNIEFLLEVHERLFKQSEFTGYGVGNYLKEVLNGINEATGGQHKLAIVSDNEFNHISNIVDLNKPTKTRFQDIFIFDVLSNHSCVREFTFTTSIPTAMSSTIAVAAGNPDSIDSLDAVSFASMNRGVSNRLYRNTPPSTKKITKVDKNKLIKQMKGEMNELVELLDNLSEFQAKVASGEYFTKGNDAWKNKVASNKHMLSRASTLVDILGTKDDDGMTVRNPPTPTPIPINIDIEIDGISGLVIGQMFRINESRLPKQYRRKKICFIIIAEETSIDAEGNWITKIKGQMQLYPGVPQQVGNGSSNEWGYGDGMNYSKDWDDHEKKYDAREKENTTRTGDKPWEDVGVSESEWYSMAPRERERLKREATTGVDEETELEKQQRLAKEMQDYDPCDDVTCNENEVHVKSNDGQDCECECEEGFEPKDGKCVEIPPPPPAYVWDDSNAEITHTVHLDGMGNSPKLDIKIGRGYNFGGHVNKDDPTKLHAYEGTNGTKEQLMWGYDDSSAMVAEDRLIYYSEYLDDWAYDIESTFDELKYLSENSNDEYEAWKASGFKDDFVY